MVPQVVWDFVEEGQAHFGILEGDIVVGCSGEGNCEGTAFQRGLNGLVASVALRLYGVLMIGIASGWWNGS